MKKYKKHILPDKNMVKTCFENSNIINTVPPLKIRIRDTLCKGELIKKKSTLNKQNGQHNTTYSAENKTSICSKSKQLPLLMPVTQVTHKNSVIFEIEENFNSKHHSSKLVGLENPINNFTYDMDEKKSVSENIQNIEDSINLIEIDVDEDDIEDYLEIDQNVVADLEALIPEEEILSISNNLMKPKVQLAAINQKLLSENNEKNENSSKLLNGSLSRNSNGEKNCENIDILNTGKSEDFIKIDIKEDVEIQTVEQNTDIVIIDNSNEDNKPKSISEPKEVNYINVEEFELSKNSSKKDRACAYLKSSCTLIQLETPKQKGATFTLINEQLSKKTKFTEKQSDEFKINKLSSQPLKKSYVKGKKWSKSSKVKIKSLEMVRKITDFLSPSSKKFDVNLEHQSQSLDESMNTSSRKLSEDNCTVLPNPFAERNKFCAETRTLRSSKQLKTNPTTKSKTTKSAPKGQSIQDRMELDTFSEIMQIKSSIHDPKFKINSSDSPESEEVIGNNPETQNQCTNSFKVSERKSPKKEVESNKLDNVEVEITMSDDQKINDSLNIHQSSVVIAGDTKRNSPIIPLVDEIKIYDDNEICNSNRDNFEEGINCNNKLTEEVTATDTLKTDAVESKDDASSTVIRVKSRDNLCTSEDEGATEKQLNQLSLPSNIRSKELVVEKNETFTSFRADQISDKQEHLEKVNMNVCNNSLKLQDASSFSADISVVENVINDTELSQNVECERKIEIHSKESQIMKVNIKPDGEKIVNNMNLSTEKHSDQSYKIREPRIVTSKHVGTVEKTQSETPHYPSTTHNVKRTNPCIEQTSVSENTNILIKGNKRRIRPQNEVRSYSSNHPENFKINKVADVQSLANANQRKMFAEKTVTEVHQDEQVKIKNEIPDISGRGQIELRCSMESKNDNISVNQNEQFNSSMKSRNKSSIQKNRTNDGINCSSTKTSNKKTIKHKRKVPKDSVGPIGSSSRFTKIGKKKSKQKREKALILSSNINVLSNSNNAFENESNIVKELSPKIKSKSLFNNKDLQNYNHACLKKEQKSFKNNKSKKNKINKKKITKMENVENIVGSNMNIVKNIKLEIESKKNISERSEGNCNENITSKNRSLISEATNNNVSTEGKDLVLEMGMNLHLGDEVKSSATSEAEPYRRIYKCNVCLKILENYNRLKAHKRVHDVKNPYQCQECGESYENVENLAAHLRIHKGKMPYPCKKCDASFWTTVQLERHQLVHVLKRGPPPNEMMPKKVFKCDECGKQFKKICDLERHTRVHTGEKPSVCNICNKRFQQAYNLNKHLLIHTQEKSFECVICQKKFGRNDVLNRHVLTHSIDKPFHCSICSKSFIRNSQLNLHRKKHHSVKNGEEAVDESVAGKSTD